MPTLRLILLPALILSLLTAGVTLFAGQIADNNMPMLVYSDATNVMLHDIQRNKTVPLITEIYNKGVPQVLDNRTLIYSEFADGFLSRCMLLHLAGSQAGDLQPIGPTGEGMCKIDSNGDEAILTMHDGVNHVFHHVDADGAVSGPWAYAHELTNNYAHISPDGNHALIVQPADDTSTLYDLYHLNIAGDNLYRLNESPLYEARMFGWSGNNRYVVVTTTNEALGESTVGWAIDMQTGETVPLNTEGEEHFLPTNFHPANWSSDRRYLAFHTQAQDTDLYNVKLFDAQTGIVSNIFDSGDQQMTFRWSPDSRYLALMISSIELNLISVYDPISDQHHPLDFPENNRLTRYFWLPSSRDYLYRLSSDIGFSFDHYNIDSGEIRTYPYVEQMIYPPLASGDLVTININPDSGNYAVNLLDLTTGASTSLPLPHYSFAPAVIVLPDQRHIMFRLPRGSLIVDTETGMSYPLDDALYAFPYLSRDERYTLLYVEMGTTRQLHLLDLHTYQIRHLTDELDPIRLPFFVR